MQAAVEDDSGADRSPLLGTLPERVSTESTEPEEVLMDVAIVVSDPYQHYAEKEEAEYRQAEKEGTLPKDATLPERESYRPVDPKEVAKEVVRETSSKRHGRSHDNFNISDCIHEPGGLTSKNVWARAPYLLTHVSQASIRYELVALMACK